MGIECKSLNELVAELPLEPLSSSEKGSWQEQPLLHDDNVSVAPTITSKKSLNDGRREHEQTPKILT